MMSRLVHVLSWGCLVISSVFARPATPNVPAIIATNITTSNSNHPLSAQPLGPSDFEIFTSFGEEPLRPEVCYIASIRLMEAAASQGAPWIEPFNGAIVWKDSPYKELIIIPWGPGPRMGPNYGFEGRYFFWAMAPILHRMTQEHRFFDSESSLLWRGERIGTLELGHWGSTPSNSRTRNAPHFSIMSSHSNYTAVENSVDQEFVYTALQGELLIEKDVFMATVGAIISLASSPSRLFEEYKGGFPGYNALVSWTNHHSPAPRSVLSRTMLARFMRKSVMYGLSHRDFHALSVAVSQKGVEIATGGYFALPPDLGSSSTSDVSRS